MKAVYHKHAARLGTTPEKILAKIEGETGGMTKKGLRLPKLHRGADVRVFPVITRASRTHSTKDYVEAYYRINSAWFGYEPVEKVNDRYFGGKLSTAPICYPDGEEGYLGEDEA